MSDLRNLKVGSKIRSKKHSDLRYEIIDIRTVKVINGDGFTEKKYYRLRRYQYPSDKSVYQMDETDLDSFMQK